MNFTFHYGPRVVCGVGASGDLERLLPAGPVLLVDDTSSSRWTLTVVGTLLRQHGVEAVFPLVLAQR